MTDINASIVLYRNDVGQVRRAIDSILGCSLDVRLYLVDNSPDDRLRQLAANDARVIYIFNNQNLGFGTAHNIALRQSLDADAKYHLVLNPDVYFDPSILTQIYEFMQDNGDVGNLMPRVFFEDGREQQLCKLLPTPVNLIARRAVPGRLRQALGMNRDYELRFWSGRQTAEIPCLSGCFMFLRVEALRRVGLFDEAMFMYVEDFDLNRRICERYKTVFYEDASITHGYNRESARNFRLLLEHAKSAVHYFNKWGWVFDPARREINRSTIRALKKLDQGRTDD